MPMIPIVASSDDLDEALRFAQLHPNARWYVAGRARALDAADRIPEDWGVPVPVTAGLGRDAERAGHAFKSALHPRGKDGRFIEKGGRVVVDRPDGSKVEGTVSEVTSNTSINVRLGDGSTLQGVKPSSISQAPTAKAHVAPVAAPHGLHPEDQSIHDAAHAATVRANESGHPSDHLDAAAAHNHAASRTAGHLQAEHQRATMEHIAAAQAVHQTPIRLEGNESIAITGPRAGQKIPDHSDAYRGADEERARATAQRQSVAEARNRDAAQYEAQQRAARVPEAKVVGGPDRLEYHDDEGNSHKFYESSVVDHGDGSYSHVTRWGRVGAKPSSKVDHYNDRTAAMEAHSKKYYEKRDKGYGKYGQGDAAAHAAEAEARHPGALAAKREADKAQVAKDHADAVDALNSDDSEWTAGRDASAPPAVKRTGPSTVDMNRAQLEEAIRNAPNETERANLQSVFDSRVRTLPGYGPRVAEEDRHDSGPTLRVSNEAQRVLMEHHIKGQISDGMWENANHGRGPNGEPGEGWKHWTDAKVVVDPEHTGRNFRPSKDNYQLNSSNLVGIVGDEMLQSVREATGNPNYSEKDLRKDLAGLSKHFKTRRDSIKAPDASGLPGEGVPSPAGGGTSRADELSQEAHEFIAGLKAPMSPEEYSHAASLHEEAADAHREAGNREQAAHHDAEADRLSNLGLDREDELAQEGKLESPRGGLDIAAAKDMSDEELAQHVHDSRSLGGQEDYHQELADRGLSLGEARDTGRVHATAPDTTGRSTTKRTEDVAATEQHELHGVGRSAANKGVVPADVAQSRVNAILQNPDHEAAHRDLAKLMSEAKLGGKQRARYREVLNEHHGSSGSGRPAGSLAEDNALRDRLAAKQNGGPLGGHPDTGEHPADTNAPPLGGHVGTPAEARREVGAGEPGYARASQAAAEEHPARALTKELESADYHPLQHYSQAGLKEIAKGVDQPVGTAKIGQLQPDEAAASARERLQQLDTQKGRIKDAVAGWSGAHLESAAANSGDFRIDRAAREEIKRRGLPSQVERENIEGFRRGLLSGREGEFRDRLSTALDEHLAKGGNLNNAPEALKPTVDQLNDEQARTLGGKEDYWKGFSGPSGTLHGARPETQKAAREAYDAGWEASGPTEALRRASEVAKNEPTLQAHPMEDIAKRHLGIDTLRNRNNDTHDFPEVGNAGMQKALQAAYERGGGKKQLDQKRIDKFASDSGLGHDLQVHNNDSQDFHETGVGDIRRMLEQAHAEGAREEAGRAKRRTPTTTDTEQLQKDLDEAETAVQDASRFGASPRSRALEADARSIRRRLQTAKDREAKQDASASPLQDDSVKRTQMEQLAGSYSDHELGAAVNRYKAGTMAGDVARAERTKRDAVRARAAEQAQQAAQRRTNPAAVKHDAEYKPGQALFDSRFGVKVSESNLGPTVVVDDHTWHKGPDGQWRHSSSYGWGGTEFAKPTAGRKGDASGVHATPQEAARLDELFNANINKYRGMRKLERSGHSPEGFTRLTDDELAAVAKYYDSPGSGHDKAQAEIQRRQRAAISRDFPAATRAAEGRRTTAIGGLTDDALRARLREDPTGPEASAISAELKARRQAKSTKTDFKAMSAAELESIAGDENNPKRPRARLELARRKREGKA